jgi:hypothetical protein
MDNRPPHPPTRGLCVERKEKADLKHDISNRMQPVFIRDRYVGCLQQTPKGFDAFNANTVKIGSYPSAATAVTYLRDRASGRST